MIDHGMKIIFAGRFYPYSTKIRCQNIDFAIHNRHNIYQYLIPIIKLLRLYKEVINNSVTSSYRGIKGSRSV